LRETGKKVIDPEKDLFLVGIFSPLFILPVVLSYVRDKSLPQVKFGMVLAIILILAVIWMTKEILVETAHGIFLISFSAGKTALGETITDLSNLDLFIYGVLLAALLIGLRILF
jgi:hypothetical protein